MKNSRNWCFLLIMFCGLLSASFAQQRVYDDTIWVPVTFYDFHSNRSNPEFEMPHTGGVRTGMVDSLLDEDGKPQLGPEPYLNHYIKYWYRPWEDSAKGDFTIPDYSTSVGYRELVPDIEFNANPEFLGIKEVDHDTAFKNVVIRDSLPFLYMRGTEGEYMYDNQYFFPLDGRGFRFDDTRYGEGWNAWFQDSSRHNYSFTMELNWKFQMREGLEFHFLGDDDVWVFINGKLAIDLGGVHWPAAGTIYMDSIAESHGLEYGEIYTFDMFYAERHTHGSTIQVSTNIIFAPPNDLTLDVTPGDTIAVGETAILNSALLSDTGVVLNYRGNIEWGFEDLYTDNPPSTFNQISDFRAELTPVQAPTTYRVWTHYFDIHEDVFLADTILVHVVPGEPYQLVIEESPDPQVSPFEPNPIDLITLDDMNATKTVYAVQRDIGGNFVGLATNPVWSSAYEYVHVNPGSPGSAVVSRSRIDEVYTSIAVQQQGLQEASANVYCPFLHSPTTVQLYPQPGTPDQDGNTAFGPEVRIQAGQPLHLYSRVFDSTSWVPELDRFVTWDIVGSSSWETFLATNAGEHNVFTTTRAHQSVIVEATIDDPSLPEYAPSSVRLTVHIDPLDPTNPGPGDPNDPPGPGDPGNPDGPGDPGDPGGPGGPGSDPYIILNIQDTPEVTDMHNPTQLDTVYMPVQGDVYLYAIIRDQFGNYIRKARFPVWESSNTNAAYIFDNVDNRATIARSGLYDDFMTEVSVNKEGVVGDTVTVIIQGETQFVAGPNNPFDPSRSNINELPSATLDYYSNIIRGRDRGILGVLNTRMPLEVNEDNTYGDVLIYDAVGNIVASLSLERARGELSYAFFWDGKNRRNRTVGAGTYLATMRAVQIDGEKINLTEKIGVAIFER
ncbi:fibro-slime domain-containing protein [Chitinispirillales bacterium ANBcel5]|uniref:fibro-slime domain-containing protein n=1 Tax=Cellulosispirillum alkaliphilum TaxID=3039283 RepID=UPI002A518539|nr:fibro-slime domain-containing protein [Chitinispirillales bacterium ANBcel5]